MSPEDNISEELKDIAPGFPLKESIEPPTGYFESFPDDVLNRWKKEESQPIVRKITWKKIIGIAAIMTGLSIGGFWFLSKPALVGTNDISAVEAYQYVNENIDEFEPLLETTDNQDDEIQPDVPHDAIEEYLMEEIHGTDPEDLF
ncbi:MAG: hypothetical protein WBP41_16800 [Saprospiraceae bacterium]